MRLFYFGAMRDAHCKLDFALAGLSHNSNEVLISAESAQSYRELATPLANVLMILFSFFAMRGAQCKLDFALAGLSHNSNEVLISTESAQSYRKLATPLANVLMILFSFFAMRGAQCKLDFALAGPNHNSNEVLISTESAQSYCELATPLANVLMILFSFFAMRGAQCKLDFALAGPSHNSNEVLISAESAQSYRELATPLAIILINFKPKL